MPDHSPAAADRNLLGAGLITGAVLAMSLADALVKMLSAEMTLWQIFAARGVVAVPTLWLAMRSVGAPTRLSAPGWAYLRAALLLAMWVAYYAALPSLTLAAAATALYAAPLMIALFASLLLGEPAGARRWLAMAIGFVGVAAILRPGDEAFRAAALLPLLGAACYALAMVLTRARCRDEPPLALALALNIALLGGGALAIAILAALGLPEATAAINPFVLGPWLEMTARAWQIAALLGVLIAGYSAATARAYQIAAPAVVAAFDYAYLVFAALWGAVLFGERPDALSLAGMALIAGGGLLAASPSGVRRRAV